MKINILTDNRKSWILPYVTKLKKDISKKHVVNHFFNHEDVTEGDLLIILSCEKILSKKTLSLNTKNIVVHPSNLPKGRGWSPLAWQILEGKNEIPICLFEASEVVDSGKIYIEEKIKLNGHELNDEIKGKQGQKTIAMVIRFIENYHDIEGREQFGKPTFYGRRRSADSEIDLSKSLEDQFNLLRVVDNKRYPAFFTRNGIKYILQINKEVLNE